MAQAMAIHITTNAAMLCSIGSGARMRLTAWITRKSAEAVMKAPCASPASGSALPWPKRCSASAGVSAWRMAKRLMEEVKRSKAESASEASIATE